MNRSVSQRILAGLLTGSAFTLGACATTANRDVGIETFNLGANSSGEPCRADRVGNDPAISYEFDHSYQITCRSVTASQVVGSLRSIVKRTGAVEAVEATLSCGDARPVELSGVGRIDARQCFDRSTGTQTIVLSTDRDDRRIFASAPRSVLGPLENGLRRLAGGAAQIDPSAPAVSTIDVAGLAPAPVAPGTAAGTAPGSSSEVALEQGISLNLRGLHLDASRVLSDALSRLPPDASPAVRAELLLEAALADSNIRFNQSANERFARAEEILSSTAGAGQPLLQRKRDIYMALHLLNQRQFRDALVRLDRIAGPRPAAGDPLRDPALLGSLNQPASAPGDAAASINVDAEALRPLLLQAQTQWARSIAMLALNDVAGAERALQDAEYSFAPLRTSRVEPGGVLWLDARLKRQSGRIALRRQNWDEAQRRFDEALAVLRQSSAAILGSEQEPGIAELQLERASIAMLRGAPPDVVQREYDAAIDVLISSGPAAAAVATGVDPYLRYLAENMDGPNRDSFQESFFRAAQAAGERGIARQINQMGTVVASDPQLSGRLIERDALERELTALRFQIDSLAPQDPAQAETLAALEARRQAAQNRLLEIQNSLAGDTRLASVEERPVTLAEMRGALRPGEVYFKVVEGRGRNFGVLIAGDATTIYPIDATAQDLATLAETVRDSIDRSVNEAGRIVEFDVGGSFALFRLLAGPAQERILAAQSIIVDPAGPLENLPMGVLVTDAASIRANRNRIRQRDYSGIAFLAARATVSNAVSPRSFVTARNLPSSAAPQPFIAFAQPTPPTPTAASQAVDVGAGCSLSYQRLADLWASLGPIDEREAQIAAAALGTPQAPVVSGSQFTDAAVVSRDDLNQFKVLHFATHGFTEGTFGCENSPPALLTSLADADSNGLLTFVEVATLRLDANLVVLSACDTAAGIERESLARLAGQEESGATLEGLVRAFLTANSRAVMATMWKVSAEEESNEFMRTFYSTARQRPIGDALQTAQRTLMATPEFSHPFFWGAFFVVGDASKMLLASPTAVAQAGGSADRGAY